MPGSVESLTKQILTVFPRKDEALAIAILELAQYYCDNSHRSYVKSAGLINFAISFLEQRHSTEYLDVLVILKRCAYHNLKAYLLSKSSRNFKILEKDFKSNLKAIREKLFLEFMQCHQNKKMLNWLYKITQEMMDTFFEELINSAVEALGSPPCQFAVAYLGSNARGQATHCSDIEFIIIVSRTSRTIYRYFQALAELMLIVVTNLSETILPAFGIPHLSSLYDDITPHAYSFDGNLNQACKTPLGAKLSGKRLYRLIGTPDELAEFTSIRWYRHDIYFPQLIRSSRYICGDKNLYDTFIQSLKNRPEVSNPAYGLALLMHDIEKYSEILSSPIKFITHKKYYYRPINALIEDLYMLLGFSTNCRDKLNMLNTSSIISNETFNHLNEVLTQTLFLRYYRHNSYILAKSLPLNQQKMLLSQFNIKRSIILSSQTTLLHEFAFFKRKINENTQVQLRSEEKLATSYINNNMKFRSKL